MGDIHQLTAYFKDYDFYNNVLSTEVRDKDVEDISLEKCDFAFISSRFNCWKKEKIIHILKTRVSLNDKNKLNAVVGDYVDHKISLEELFEQLTFKIPRFSQDVKSEINEIEQNSRFFVFYPVVLNKTKQKQQPMFTFSCECQENAFQIQKAFVNKNVLTLLLSETMDMHVSDIKTSFGKKMDEMVSAVDALHASPDFSCLYQTICEEFERIFGVKLGKCRVPEEWQQLGKAMISFESSEAVIENCFYDEMETMARFISQDSIIPETVKLFMGLSDRRPQDISKVLFKDSHIGSYQAKYPVNQKQWKLMQLVSSSKILCVEGPPGTGKTTLLKEMIADAMVQKADALLKVWDEPWTDMGKEGKEISRSPLMGKNLYSIIISSTNNKAVDNIGFELLKEVSFFSEFTHTTLRKPDGEDAENDEAETNEESAVKICENNVVYEDHEHHEKQKIDTDYEGIFCARLGKAKQVEDFYRSIFQPFLVFLEGKEISAEEEEAVRARYAEVRQKMKDLNRAISDFISQRDTHGVEFSPDKLRERQKALEAMQLQLDMERKKWQKECRDTQKQLKGIREDIECWKQEMSEKVNECVLAQKLIRSLYSDLEEYMSITGLKRLFSFLFPKTRRVQRDYGSEQQIRDKIETENVKCSNLEERMRQLQQDISQAEERQKALLNEAEKIHKQLSEISSNEADNQMEQEILKEPLGSIEELRKRVQVPEDQWMGLEPHELYSLPDVYKLRNQLFLAALSLFECYIVRHKEPILNNLKLLLIKKDGDSGNGFYNWCSVLYNGDAPYSEKRAELVRILWETFFLCFPVVTTTLHSFRKKVFAMVPELFDLLLIDESGQIVPYYALAPLYRVRRAVFVGDVNQIEPIKNVPSGLFKTRYTEMLGEDLYKQFCLDDASAQRYAVSASDFYEMAGSRRGGVILNEHRRCEPAIMAFSNELVYGHVLELTGDNNNDKLFGSNLAAFDIRGVKAAQHYNSLEIQACKEIIELFVERYGEGVKKDIGIITPFSRQAAMLREQIHGVETGTVHVFQGAEKKYILFSCVVDDTEKPSGLCSFIGGKCNLLNVAFSRAKEQFIFVGNIQAAENSGNYLKEAVGIIKKYGKVFSFFDTQDTDADNFPADELVIRVLSGKQLYFDDDKIGEFLNQKIPHNIIDTPRLHNEILNEMLLRANSSIHIISPWIGHNVVTDAMLETIRSKIEEGIKIHIVFGYKAVKCSLDDIDELVRQDIPWGKETAAQTIKSLLEILGGDLEYLPPSHVKLLLADDRYLLIGSLNWLFNSGKTSQKEISCLVTNTDTIQYVKRRFLERH
ncbi:hypothetical protein GPL15_02490 [Clostridium sp. MCC353]|uniref:AAA domain-containing protein n=1 Tax=Clostridium sp. MCC353 TaxID=2592646 RepID=UPI001C02F2D3|nr:AAA domain-containing protein [Clostridium sp. MCC353]MBT9775377.1 hypothetical protein [Clostridium sp. MCC353]